MKRTRIPVNIFILNTESPAVRALPKITTLDIMEGSSSKLHPSGLFSTDIFGRIGDPQRDRRYARIELKVPVLDPTVYEIIISLKGLYKEIMAGRKFAYFDEDLKDFYQTDPTKGDTGYDFFFQHWKKIEFKRTNSDRRDTKIKNLEKYKQFAEIKNFLVVPAGVRDIEFGDNGRPEEHEVNDLYRKVLSAARVLEDAAAGDLRAVNASRFLLQRAIHEIWDYYVSFFGGKTGYFMRRVASRNIANGTRNVISAMDVVPAVLGEVGNPTINDTQVGILQSAKALMPVTLGNVRRHMIKYHFSSAPEETAARLIDPRTMLPVTVNVPFNVRDGWMSVDGLTKVVAFYEDPTVRDKPIIVEGHYLGLIYEGPDRTFKFISSVDEIPEDRSKTDVRPVSLTDIIYLTNHRDWAERYIFPTRYPVAGLGSIYASSFKLTSTVPDERRTELNDDWQIDDQSEVVDSYPRRKDATYYDTMSVHPSRLEGLSGDHDGDMTSGNAIYSDEAVEEQNRLLGTAANYLDPRGGMRASMDFYTSKLVAHNLTRGDD